MGKLTAHGSLEINGHRVGRWKAENEGPVFESDRSLCRYRVEVDYTLDSGYKHTVTFYLNHKREKGMLILASRVLRAAEHEVWQAEATRQHAIRQQIRNMK